MGVYLARLPSAYQEVEYIESSGTQKINTGYTTNSNMRVVCEFYTTNTATNNVIFATENGSWSWSGYMLCFTNNTDFLVGTNSETKFTGTALSTKHKVDFSLSSITLDSTTITKSSSVGTYNISLFQGNGNSGKVRIYSFKAYTGATLNRDLVPCYRKSDNVIGMYDLVNNQFYTNSGSGTFTKGADVMSELKNAYIGEYVEPLFDFGDWTNSQWTVMPNGNQGTVTKTATYISFYNSNNSTSNYLSQYPIDGTKNFLLEFNANIPNTSLSYHSIGITTVPTGNNIDFHTNRESTYRNKIWCETYDGTTTVRQGGETNPGTADYFIKKEGNTLTMGRNGATKYTKSSFPFASTYYLNEGVYRATATIYTAKLTYL